MKLHQLQQLFKNLPLEFMEEIKEQDFKLCWYGSAGIDKRPMELFDSSHPDALIDETVQVFFYTDIDYVKIVDRLIYFHDNVSFQQMNQNDYFKIGEMYSELVCFNEGHEYYLKQNVFNQFSDRYKQKVHWVVKDGIIKEGCNTQSITNIVNEINFQELYDDLLNEKKNHEDELNKLFENQEHKSSPLKELFESIEPTINSDKLKEKNNQLEDKFIENYQFGATLVKHKANNNSNIYCFYIDCDDWTFEKLLIRENLKINYVAHWGGWAGPGPTCLGNLQVEYGIGHLQTINDEVDFNVMPHKLEKIKEFNWDQIQETNKRPFYKVII